MTKEEIRGEIYQLLWRVAKNRTFPSDALAELNELVVIKTDRGFELSPYMVVKDRYEQGFNDGIRAREGCVAVESLMGDE